MAAQLLRAGVRAEGLRAEPRAPARTPRRRRATLPAWRSTSRRQVGCRAPHRPAAELPRPLPLRRRASPPRPEEPRPAARQSTCAASAAWAISAAGVATSAISIDDVSGCGATSKGRIRDDVGRLRRRRVASIGSLGFRRRVGRRDIDGLCHFDGVTSPPQPEEPQPAALPSPVPTSAAWAISAAGVTTSAISIDDVSGGWRQVLCSQVLCSEVVCGEVRHQVRLRWGDD